MRPSSRKLIRLRPTPPPRLTATRLRQRRQRQPRNRNRRPRKANARRKTSKQEAARPRARYFARLFLRVGVESLQNLSAHCAWEKARKEARAFGFFAHHIVDVGSMRGVP